MSRHYLQKRGWFAEEEENSSKRRATSTALKYDSARQAQITEYFRPIDRRQTKIEQWFHPVGYQDRSGLRLAYGGPDAKGNTAQIDADDVSSSRGSQQ